MRGREAERIEFACRGNTICPWHEAMGSHAVSLSHYLGLSGLVGSGQAS
jgi:hypothetical protein